MRKSAPALFLASLLAIACGTNDTNPTEPESGPQLNEGDELMVFDPVLSQDQKITIEGIERNYHLFIPAIPSTADIVFLFHGYSGSANQILGISNTTTAPYKIWLDIAERENLILIVPDGNESSSGNQGWNDCRADIPEEHPDSDDVAFFEALLETTQNRFSNLEGSVYVMGTSNGGFMTQRLADEIPGRLNAVAVVVASRPVNSACMNSSVPLSVLIMNGTDDPLTPYEGGQIASNRGEVLSTSDTIDYWVERNQTSSIPEIVDLPDIDSSENSTIRQHSYNNGTKQTRVELIEMINAGHTEPSLSEHYAAIFKLIVGNQNRDIEMAEVVWQFFSK